MMGRIAFALAFSMLTATAVTAATGTLRLQCTNPVGGATWSMVVDLDHRLVDSRPAEISNGWISWRDQHGGIYELDRSTGKLRLRAASTTGGYFLYYDCKLE